METRWRRMTERVSGCLPFLLGNSLLGLLIRKGWCKTPVTPTIIVLMCELEQATWFLGTYIFFCYNLCSLKSLDKHVPTHFTRCTSERGWAVGAGQVVWRGSTQFRNSSDECGFFVCVDSWYQSSFWAFIFRCLWAFCLVCPLIFLFPPD